MRSDNDCCPILIKACWAASTLINAVLLNNIHFGVVGTTVTLQDVDVVSMVDFGGVCLVPEDHPLARSAAPVDVTEFDAESFVSYDRQMLETMQFAPEVVEHLVSKAKITYNSTPAIVAICRATSTPAIVDQMATRTPGLAEGLVARSIVQPSRHGLAIVKRPERNLPKPTLELATILQTIMTVL